MKGHFLQGVLFRVRNLCNHIVYHNCIVFNGFFDYHNPIVMLRNEASRTLMKKGYLIKRRSAAYQRCFVPQHDKNENMGHFPYSYIPAANTTPLSC